MLHLVSGADGKRYVPFYSASSPFCSYFPEWFEVNGECTTSSRCFIHLLSGTYYLFAQQCFYAEKARFHGLFDVMKEIQHDDCPFRVHKRGAQLGETEAWRSTMFAVCIFSLFSL